MKSHARSQLHLARSRHARPHPRRAPDLVRRGERGRSRRRSARPARQAGAREADGGRRAGREIDVKFAEGSDLRLRRRRLVSERKGRIVALDEVLARFRGLHISRLFASTSENRLAAARRQARARSPRRQADMNLYFRIETGSTADTVALLDALNALDIVEVASAVDKPAKPPVTPSFVARQGYRSAAAGGGMNAEFALARRRQGREHHDRRRRVQLEPLARGPLEGARARRRSGQRHAVRPVRLGGRRHRSRHRGARRAGG